MIVIARYYSVICTFLVAVCIIILFVVKYEVQKLASHLQLLESNIQQKQESIHILRAELAYLSQPKAIQSLVGRHLHLKLVSPEQVISLK